jgi:adenylate cyclase
LPRLDKDQSFILIFGLALSVFLSGFYVFRPEFLVSLDYKAYDALLRGMELPEPSKSVVVVDIDEPTLSRYGQWPWPRYRVALLLGRINQMKPAAVAVDMVFPEPDRTSPKVMQRALKRDLKLNVSFTGLPQGLMDYDPIMAGVLKTGPFVLGYDFLFKGQASSGGSNPIHRLRMVWLKDPDASEPSLFRPKDALVNLPGLTKAAPLAGYFNALPDRDGILRRSPVMMQYSGGYYPSLALAAVMQSMNTKQVLAKLGPSGLESIKLGSRVIPLGDKATMLIKYRGRGKSYTYISAGDILSGNAMEGDIKGKLIFLGTSAGGLKDLRATPFDPACPGVELHATMADNILHGQYLLRPAWAPGLELILIFLVGLVCTLLFGLTMAMWSLPAGVAAGAGLWFFSEYVLQEHGLFLSPIMPVLSFAVVFAVLSLLKFWREERKKRFFKGAFSQYVSPAVVDRLSASPGLLSLQGEEREITVFFSDIRGFTGISEKLKPQEVTSLLKAYFTPTTRCITEHQGTLDKFMGDALMAFWNAPLDTPGHPELALKSSLEILARLDGINQKLAQEFDITIKVGIGLASGPAYVGNMGSNDLFNYTAVGDMVNLASRLEGLSKFYGLPLIISESVAKACGPDVVCQPLDKVRVKGMSQPVTIYTAHDAATARGVLAEELAMHKEAWQAFWDLEFTRAERLFSELSQTAPQNRAYAQYLQACRQYLQAPPRDQDQMILNHQTK